MRRLLNQVLVLCLVVGGASRALAEDTDGGDDFPSGLPPIEYRFEAAEITGNDSTLDTFFRNLLGLEAGDLVRVQALDTFRARLLATGFFSDVQARLREGSQPESVVVEVRVEEQNTVHVDELHLGHSDDEALWGGIELAETNLFGTGLLLSGAFVISTQQGAVEMLLADPYAAMGFPLTWHLRGAYNSGVGRGPSRDENGQPVEEAFEVERIEAQAGLGYAILPALRADLGFELQPVHFEFVDPQLIDPRTGVPQGDSLLTLLQLALTLDLTDRPLLPTRGTRAGLSAELAVPGLGSDYEYLSLTGQVEQAFALGGGHVLRVDALVANLWSDGDAPFFEAYYIGDVSDQVADRVLGLTMSDARLLDVFANGADLVTHCDRLGQLRAEWGIPVGRLFGPLSRAELFFNVGLLLVEQGPWEIGHLRSDLVGRPAAPDPGLHPDANFNLGFRADTPWGLWSFSLGTLSAFAPFN